MQRTEAAWPLPVSGEARRRSASNSRIEATEQRRQSRRSTSTGNNVNASSRVNASDKRERRRRNRTKARADKLFDKNYAFDTPSSNAAEENAPRAALYEGEMGATHRRSARMQRTSVAEPLLAKVNPAGWLASLNVTPRALKLATAALCVVLTCAFLYTPAQQLYQAQRDRDRLETEYSFIEQRNDVLDTQNDSLASNAGMEDAVREKYGYVIQGDQTAVVTGLSESATDTARDSEGIEANVLSSTVKAPEEWYTPYLDVLFGVK